MLKKDLLTADIAVFSYLIIMIIFVNEFHPSNIIYQLIMQCYSRTFRMILLVILLIIVILILIQ